MGNLNALPALDVRPPATPPDPLAEFARVAQIRGQQQTQQAQAQEMQIRQQQINDEQATTSALRNWDPATGDFDGLTKGVLSNGGSAKAAAAAQKYGLDVANSVNQLQKDKINDYKEHQTLFADRLGPLTDPNVVSDEELPGKAQATIKDLIDHKIVDPAQGMQMQQAAQSITDPAALRQKIGQVRTLALGSAGYAAQQKTAAETAEANAKTKEANASADEKQWQKFPEMGVLYNPTTGEVKTPLGQSLPPAMLESKYVALQQKKSLGQPLSPEDAAFSKAFEKFKTLVPVANFNLQNSSAAADNQGNPSAIAQAIANNQMKWSEAVSPRTPQSVKNSIMAQVFKINPNYDTAEFGLESATAQKARSGAWADTRLAYNTAIDHADQLLAASNALKNGDVQKLNQLKNYFSTQFGSPDATTAQAIANAYNHEVTSVVAKGHMTDAEVAQGHGTLDVNKASPDQIKGVAQAYKNLMTSKRDELDKIIKSGAGNKANGVMDVQSGSASSGKSVSLAAAKLLPFNQGKTDEQISADIKAHGHTVAP